MNCTIIRATDFRETIRERAQREPRFRKALLREAIELMLSGDGNGNPSAKSLFGVRAAATADLSGMVELRRIF